MEWNLHSLNDRIELFKVDSEENKLFPEKFSKVESLILKSPFFKKSPYSPAFFIKKSREINNFEFIPHEKYKIALFLVTDSTNDTFSIKNVWIFSTKKEPAWKTAFPSKTKLFKIEIIPLDMYKCPPM